MPRRPKKKAPRPSEAAPGEPPAGEGRPGIVGPTGGPEVPRRPGLPAPESVVSETDFTSPTGRKYRIIHTTETDPKDKPEPKRPKRGSRRDGS